MVNKSVAERHMNDDWRRRGHVVDVSDTADSVSVLLFVVVDAMGVTQLGDVVYILCRRSSTIRRLSATTLQRLTDIDAKGVKDPWDIAACERMSQLYVADWSECVWRVSPDGADIKRWLPKSPSDTISPSALSMTSSRLLVTSFSDKQLIHLDAGGDELRRVPLPDYMYPSHAVESPSGTFIVGHGNTQLDQPQVSEVNTEGQVLRQFSGSLGAPEHIAADSHGNIIVADMLYCRILLLDAKLALRRVIMDEHQLNYQKPWRVCYMEQSGQLLVGFDVISFLDNKRVAVFDLLRR